MQSTQNRRQLTLENEQEENEQLAELIRFAAYTGLRQGELVVLQWLDVNVKERTATVERALSGATIGAPKSGKTRVVPLGAPAFDALRRLRRRPNFTHPDDYVFATLAGDRPDASRCAVAMARPATPPAFRSSHFTACDGKTGSSLAVIDRCFSQLFSHARTVEFMTRAQIREFKKPTQSSP